MLGPPPLWGWFTRELVRLDPARRWSLWHALVQARWSASVEWRTQFLAFDAPDRVLSRDLVEDFFREIASPRQLMALVEALRHEGTLLARDSQQIEETLLSQITREGQWKHLQGVPHE